jgi:hypothetical protein
MKIELDIRDVVDAYAEQVEHEPAPGFDRPNTAEITWVIRRLCGTFNNYDDSARAVYEALDEGEKKILLEMFNENHHDS